MALQLLFILEVSHQKLTGEFSIHSQLSKQTATLWHLQLDSYKEREVYAAYSILMGVEKCFCLSGLLETQPASSTELVHRN